MSSMRVSVEWLFGDVITQFAYLNYKSQLKLFLQPVAKYYEAGVILQNCRVLCYGGVTTSFFGAAAPFSMREYLRQ